jgi:two-component system nitrate/nitrite response regulator NarP
MNEKLTDREQEILSYIAKGMTNKEIASELCISRHTVKAHISEILRKLKLNNRINAAIFFYAQNQGM